MPELTIKQSFKALCTARCSREEGQNLRALHPRRASLQSENSMRVSPCSLAQSACNRTNQMKPSTLPNPRPLTITLSPKPYKPYIRKPYTPTRKQTQLRIPELLLKLQNLNCFRLRPGRACRFNPVAQWEFPKIRVPCFGVLIIRILPFRVLY